MRKVRKCARKKPLASDKVIKLAQEELVVSEGSSSNRGLLLQRFTGLHEYLFLLGEHINQIQSNLDRIDKNIDQMRKECNSTIESEKTELQHIKECMVTKIEVESLLQELNNIIKGAFPQLTGIPE